MKFSVDQIPKNAFLKVWVCRKLQKVYFTDVKMYKKILRRHPPTPPPFSFENEWNKSQLTLCGDCSQ